MSIYDFSPKHQKNTLSVKSSNESSVVLPQQLSNNKELSKSLKQKGINISAKELIYDGNEEVIGVITRKDEPYFFSQSELEKIRGIK